MNYEIFLDNKWATVRYHSGDQYVYHTFHQPISGEEFRHVLNTGLDTFIAKGATKWLSDDRLNAQFAPEDIEFAVTDWGPRAADAGWKYWALVVPEDIAGRASMQDIVNGFYEMGVRVAIFTKLDEARQWLVKQ